jgi:CRP-like cAMP-binding protein
MPDPAREMLATAVRAVSPVPDDDLAALAAAGRMRQLRRGEALTRAGEPARYGAVVLAGGLCEHYELADGSRRTISFSLPGSFAGSLSDLLGTAAGGVSRAWVVAEVPSEVLVVPWDRYLALVDTRPAWSRFARRLVEGLYLQKVAREYELLALDAAERYRCTLARYPGVEDVFRQYHIASYVGVTPQHLSRLRAAASPR